MKKKELLQQLNSLKDKIKPDADWQADNREILLSQINAQTRLDFAKNKFKLLPNLFQRKFAMSFLKPMVSLVIILVFVFGAWTASVSATKKSLPGDLFYNIKLTTERVQVNLTLNDEKRANLEIAFAQRRLDEIEKIIEQNEPDNLAIPLQRFRENMNNVKSNLAKLEIKDKESAVKIANMIDEKTAKYVDVLIDQQEKSPEVALNAEEAISASKSTGDKALSLIIEEYENGDSDLSEEDIVGKVQNRLNDLESSLNSVKTEIDLIIQAQEVEAERLAQEAAQAAEKQAAEEATAAETAETNNEETAEQEPTAEETETTDTPDQTSDKSSQAETNKSAELTELADNEESQELTEPADNEEATDNDESTEPTVAEQITDETEESVEDLPAIEKTKDLRVEALTLLTDAKNLLDDKKISQAFAKIKQADDLASLINKAIVANSQYLEQAKAEQEIESNEESDSDSESEEENPADKNSAAQLLSE